MYSSEIDYDFFPSSSSASDVKYIFLFFSFFFVYWSFFFFGSLWLYRIAYAILVPGSGV